MRPSAQQLFKHYADIMPQPELWHETVASPLPQCFWVNTLKVMPDTLQTILSDCQIDMTPMSWGNSGFRGQAGMGKHWTYLTGLLQIQEEVSQLPGVILQPKPGERVLDLCAAPGNKTAQFAVAMNNQGVIVANDRNYNRLRALGQIVKRLGLLNISVSIYDGNSFPGMSGYFDKILVDAPCSCEGTFRKSDTKVFSPNRQQSLNQARQQLALLRRAIQLCKVGGEILYSTCTFAPEENEQVVDQALTEFAGGIELLPIHLSGFNWSPGLTEWQQQHYDRSLAHAMRVWPQQNNTGGFFVALLRKTAECSKSKPKPIRENTVEDIVSDDVKSNLQLISERFGIDKSILQQYHFAQARRGLYAYHYDGSLPQSIRVDAQGVLFFKTNMQHPKLTTAAAMLVGQYATRNYIIFSSEQANDYFNHQDIILTSRQIECCTDTGYVLVMYQGICLGVAILFKRDDGQHSMLRSLFPKKL